MSEPGPLAALLEMRVAITVAIEKTELYGYDEFNERMKALRKESYELFKLFDSRYSE